ncbi:MAG: hypothetical protein ACR2HA_00940 [Nocardioides sp.]
MAARDFALRRPTRRFTHVASRVGALASIIFLAACGGAISEAAPAEVAPEAAALAQCESLVGSETYTSVLDVEVVSGVGLRHWFETRPDGAHSRLQPEAVDDSSAVACLLEAPGIVHAPPPVSGVERDEPWTDLTAIVLMGATKGPELQAAGPRDKVVAVFEALRS